MNETDAARILAENLLVFSERGELSAKQRNLCAEELCLRWSRSRPEQTAQERYREFCAAVPHALPEDKARLCRHLSVRLKEREGFGGEDTGVAGTHGRIALVRNRYTEEAFSCFSEIVSGAKPHYPTSFASVCEDVFDRRCEFGILPIENTQDGRLFSFYAMLNRYELRICADCSLETENLAGVIRFALIGRHMPDRMPRDSEDWNLECSVTASLGEFPSDILRVASLFGATLQKIDSIPVLYDDGLVRFYFTFRLPRSEAVAFDLYLTMEHPYYAPIGHYPSLTEF